MKHLPMRDFEEGSDYIKSIIHSLFLDKVNVYLSKKKCNQDRTSFIKFIQLHHLSLTANAPWPLHTYSTTHPHEANESLMWYLLELQHLQFQSRSGSLVCDSITKFQSTTPQWESSLLLGSPNALAFIHSSTNRTQILFEFWILATGRD